MDGQVDFFGPVHVYVREEDGRWVAWADPFAEVGVGETRDAAVAAVQRSVEEYLSLVAEELAGPEPVELLTPLTDEEKRGATRLHFMLYALRPAEPEAREAGRSFNPTVARPLEALLEVLRTHTPVHAGPLELCEV